MFALRVRREVGRHAELLPPLVGGDASELRFLDTDEGLVAHMTLRLGSGQALSDAHARASEIEERIRLRLPEIDDVVVHTEPGE